VTDGHRKRFYNKSEYTDRKFTDRIFEAVEDYFLTNRRGITKKELMEEFGVGEKVIRQNLKKISGRLQIKREGRFLRYYPDE